MTAALPMGGQKITGMADPTVSTDGSTKNYVDTLTAAFFSTGDVKLTLKTSADSGWVMFDDGTIGSATSGATSYANALAQPLFTLLFNNISDTYSPIFTSGGGATTRGAQVSASAAWAANCRISLTKTLGRALGVAGSGSGLTGRPLGQTFGEENHALAASEIPSITSSGSISVNSSRGDVVTGTATTTLTSGGAGANFQGITNGTMGSGTLTSNGTANLTSNNTGGGAHNTMQPTVFLNCMVKL